MYIFPADPGRPLPDWSALRGDLLERAFMIEARGDNVPFRTLCDLWNRIVATRDEGRRAGPARMHNLSALLNGLIALKLVPDLAIDCARLNITEFIAALREIEVVTPDFGDDIPVPYRPGPLYLQFSDDAEGDLSASARIVITYEDYGGAIRVRCDDNLFAPPGIPGTDRVVPSWRSFRDRWVGNPSETWLDPETGRCYGLLDLDWDDTLAASRCSLTIEDPAYLDGNRAAALMTELTGSEFRFAYSDHRLGDS
jgi:hypothetical protein